MTKSFLVLFFKKEHPFFFARKHRMQPLPVSIY